MLILLTIIFGIALAYSAVKLGGYLESKSYNQQWYKDMMKKITK